MKLIIIDTNKVKEITEDELKNLKDIDQVRVIEYCRLKANPVENQAAPKIVLMVSVNKTSKINGQVFNEHYHHMGYDRSKLENHLLEYYKISKLVKDIADEFPYFTDGGFKYTAESENWIYEFLCYPYNIVE
jgi:hypothetical protein